MVIPAVLYELYLELIKKTTKEKGPCASYIKGRLSSFRRTTTHPNPLCRTGSNQDSGQYMAATIISLASICLIAFFLSFIIFHKIKKKYSLVNQHDPEAGIKSQQAPSDEHDPNIQSEQESVKNQQSNDNEEIINGGITLSNEANEAQLNIYMQPK